MVESGREYVLQWPGHAAYVTERFSGLLARQALVDVTLICEEQKLRVHKLVLASCSLYFEEILAQDLGAEPVILLRDLNFSILKAMIEFMYCGETTVSHIHLPSLLAAARLFKVKELESLVEKMVGFHTQDQSDNEGEFLNKEVGRVNGLLNNDDNGIRVSFTNKHSGNGQSTFDGTESSDSECERNYLEENITGNFLDSPNERCLYEEPCHLVKDRIDCVKNKNGSYSSLHRVGEVPNENALRKKHAHREKSIESESDSSSVPSTSSSTMDSERGDQEDKSTNLYERCCEFVSNGCAKSEERTQVYLGTECTDSEVNRVGQCSKVYTHKKRKNNGATSSNRHAHFEKAVPTPHTSNRIDLINESSNDKAPVTLKTNLDEESPDYLLSFNSESIQSIVGCSLSDFCPSTRFELLNARTHLAAGVDVKKNVEEEEEGEDEGEDEDEAADRPPVLRRSVRLNQQETEESYSPRLRSKLRDDKKSKSSANMKLLSRTKRKNKDLERRVPNVKMIIAGASRKNHARPLRKTPKIANRCASKNHQLTKSEREVSKPKTNDKAMANSETADGHQHYSASETIKTNTSASVNRALWGDMSDVTEDGEISEEFLEYSTSAEIPFAVGLLPLRAALEKLQATPDHQPRRTRLSVATTKLESSGLKRKASPSQQEVPSTPKKQSLSETGATPEENPSAVCHIQIRTSPQCSKPRKRSLSDGVTPLERTTINGTP